MARSAPDLADTIRDALRAPGVPLAEALAPWEYVELDVPDARAVVTALAEITDVGPLLVPGAPLEALALLFQNDATDDATRLLAADGLPHLARLFDAAAQHPNRTPDALVAVCRVFALYAYRPGVPRIAAAVRAFPDGAWRDIFGLFAEPNHPHSAAFVEQLRDPLPGRPAGVLLLELANVLVRQGRLAAHPFDTPAGRALLAEWLAADDEEPEARAELAWAARRCGLPADGP